MMFNVIIRKSVNLIKNIHQKSTYKLLYTKYGIGNENFLQGKGCEIYGDGCFYVGEYSYCGNLGGFQVVKGHKITIGSNVAISHNVRIYTSNRNAEYFLTGNGEKISSGNVTIGNNVWIGANVFITEGVTIDDNVVIGANSVITNDISSGCVVGGVPGKVIKKY
ncbi:acyltransferase [Photobacterium frigidiphilum]|uniref:Acyltransferase n=1 Tax=Photobacterium frigidiphilum TaxID=264736 RepID=A0A2T3JPF5_9GAMM|nr:acyltransferase [Photobacterium frigidiphilum]PSU50932.1 acyltransferase [Photobacterium frigidiphilum]